MEAVKAVSRTDLGELGAEVAEWYQHYGALFAGSDGWKPGDAEEYTRYIQRHLGAKQTGILTKEQAAHVMSQPRCGYPDLPPGARALAGGKWKSTELTYYVAKFSGANLSVDVIADVLSKAWGLWSSVSPIKGNPVLEQGRANCIHDTGSGRADGMDGPGGVLAWAELPPTIGFAGTLLNRFDAGEQWTDATDARSIRLLNVACHEIGHLLGLDHSGNPSDLMAPFYDADVESPQRGDIDRINKLYPSANPTPTPNPNPNPNPNPTPNPNPQPNPRPVPNDPPGRCPRWRPLLPRLFPRRARIC